MLFDLRSTLTALPWKRNQLLLGRTSIGCRIIIIIIIIIMIIIIIIIISGSIALLLSLGLFLGSLSYTQSVGLLGQGISLSQDLYLYQRKHKDNKCAQTSTFPPGFKPMTPAFDRTKVVRLCCHCDLMLNNEE
jgi:hypothetical protein